MTRPTAKEAILDTAERLFAEQGMEAVSLRSINTEAGYSVAALHYHFGSREGLIGELLERRQDPILSRRQVLLDALEDQKKPEIREITEALVLPLAEPIFSNPELGLRTIKFFFRTYVDQGSHERVKSITEESYRIFDSLLAQALPHIDKPVLHQRWVIATQLAFQGLANIDGILADPKDQPLEKNYRRYVDQLIDFIAGGLTATERGD